MLATSDTLEARGVLTLKQVGIIMHSKSYV